uniref:RNA-directed DNA polymerase, eukaryota, reverse transcriptase zinc-binding domain protein n=1 Tax=Tanacetum cinerariifolium TaxID=118510 RepID=A0A699J8Y8_TANCI|nr:RNA-directed DNA polymerase, eukaryota, reverse transcriptase zinc-binding domain protein [Tanacetum cinerariifolium]
MMVLGDIVNEVQSAFIANGQILDGPFILNEVYQWCKKQKKPTMIFKVDFEKAYDSVRWDYLDDVLKNFGFGDKWRGWIQNCQWSDANIGTIVHVLECFHRASGLRINMNKNKIMGISVAKSIVEQAATKIGYAILTVPFSYLSSKVMGVTPLYGKKCEEVIRSSNSSILGCLGRWTVQENFVVASVRKLIDDGYLPSVSSKTIWINVVPIKINIHAWKVKLDCLPTRLNISRRGMDIDSILCPSCGTGVESTSHVLKVSKQEYLRVEHSYQGVYFLRISSLVLFFFGVDIEVMPLLVR